jgi:hypothetical protein
MRLSWRTRVAALVALLLFVGSWMLAGCDGAESTGLEDGPGMLYFYADW